jgi:hypothetical protein
VVVPQGEHSESVRLHHYCPSQQGLNPPSPCT